MSDEPAEPELGDDPAAAEDARQRRRWSLRPWAESDPTEESPAEREQREHDETLLRRFAQQWALVREDRHRVDGGYATGPSNLQRAQVPFGLDLAASWAWRLLLIAAAAYGLFWLVGYFAGRA